jgi:hypothetical protein
MTPITDSIRNEISQGLLYTHSRLNANTSKTLEVASFLYALIELLEEKGLISIEALDARKRAVGERLAEQFRQSGNGVLFQEPEYDKYTCEQEVEIDCQHRLHLCRAACCRLPFALSKQDVREGVVQWELGQPYMIAQNGRGYCCHLDCNTFGCTVYEHRPVPCRAFDCRHDQRIWLDFERMIVNPAIERLDWLQWLAEQTQQNGQGVPIDRRENE